MNSYDTKVPAKRENVENNTTIGMFLSKDRRLNYKERKKERKEDILHHVVCLSIESPECCEGSNFVKMCFKFKVRVWNYLAPRCH